MSLSTRLAEHVRACFAGLWVQSHEHEDALAEIAQLCREEAWSLATWDIERGLHVAGAEIATSATDPLSAVRALSALTQSEQPVLLVLANFHRFLSSAEVVQALVHQITAGKQHRTFVVILSPVVQIPTELEKLFVVLEHELPNREQLTQIARGVATEDGELPQTEELARVLDAAAGLTRYEAEGAFSLSLVRYAGLVPEAIWELKAGALKKQGLVSLHRGRECFDELGGLAALKRFCTRALASRNEAARPRGTLLLGVPGTGKSAFAKALGNETNRPTLVLDVGALYGSLVGQTEQNVRQALKIAEAMAPCVLFVDEIEKALAGSSGNNGDSGVATRLFGTLLSWLNDKSSDIFVIATANNIAQLPPEFSRAERFDGVFFIDLPSHAERQAIWRLHLANFGLNAQQTRPVDTGWTGAEIRACCRLAALLEIPLVEAGQHVVPVSATAAESIDRLRAWADGRCLAADRGGIFRRERGGRKGRKSLPDPEMN